MLIKEVAFTNQVVLSFDKSKEKMGLYPLIDLQP